MTALSYQRRTCCSGSRGFTLVEAFVVIAVIAVMAVISVPAIINTLSFQALNGASEAFANQVEFSRVQAAARNRAYEIRVTLSTGTESGAIVLNEGTGSACTPEVFVTDGTPPDPVEKVREVDFEKEYETVHIEAVEPQDLSLTSLCVKPDGRVLRLDSGGPVLPAPDGYAAGEAVFTLRLHDGDGNPTQHVRRVVIPYNGIPKLE
jgi:hypothetical protein